MALTAIDKARKIKEFAIASIVVSELLLAGSLRDCRGALLAAPIGEEAEEVRRSMRLQANLLADAEAMIEGERLAVSLAS